MKVATTLAVLPSLLLSFAQATAQDALKQGLIVRYDAATVRLHEALLETLLSEELCRGVQTAVWGEEAGQGDWIDVRISPLDIPQGASEWFQQPDGVFAGILWIRFLAAAPQEKRTDIPDALLAALQDSLKQRLGEGPREWFARQRDAVFEELVRAQEQLQSVRAELQALPAGSPEALARHWATLLEEQATLELDIQTDQAALQFFEQRMAEAQAELDRAQKQQQRSTALLADLHHRLQQTEAELAGAREKAEIVSRLAAELDRIRAEIAERGSERAALESARTRAEQKIQLVAVDIQDTSLELHRFHSRLEALSRQIEDRARAIAEAGENSGKRADLEFRVRLLEQEIERLRQRASELTDRMGGLREVQVELWR